ncbi:MAG: hypothetical protein JSW40_04390, partial [Candidatus Omnitrophota bacterium]
MAKTLLIYASFGEGHKKAASSLKDFLNAPCEDLLDFAFPHTIKKIYPRAYLFVTEHLPLLWQFFFFLTRKSFVKFVLTHLHRCLFLPFFQYLEALNPEIIITTHFFPLPLIAILKAKQNFKVITIVTDLRV